MKRLIVTEKPSVARDFARALAAGPAPGGGRAAYYENDQYVISFCLGHLFRLKEPGEYRDEWKRWSSELLVPDPFEKLLADSRKDQAEVLIRLIASDDIELLINAGDAGREGEGIQRELYEEAFRRLGREKPVLRFWTSEALSREAIRLGLEQLRPASDFDGLYRAFLARERADWLIGFNATRSFTSTLSPGGKPLSIGRVQTPVLALIVRREEEIESFRSERFFCVHGSRGNPEGDDHLEARALAPDDPRGDRFSFWDEAAALALAGECRGQNFRVERVEEKEKREYPPRLFSMPSLQEQCNRAFGWAPDHTLALAQSLYEKRFQTYPRTDSEYLGTTEQNEAFITPRARAAAGVLPRGPELYQGMLAPGETGRRIFHDRKVTDHHAIVPTDLADTSVRFDQLPAEEKTMFSLVAMRFLLAFHPPAIHAEGEALLICATHRFIARARRTVDPGWTLFQAERSATDARLNLVAGEEFPLEIRVESHETSPPRRFTQGDIIHAMTHAHKYVAPETPKDLVEALREADGIGTGATRDSFIPLLVARGYIEVKRNVVIPLPRGRDLIRMLAGQRITDFAWTAMMERRLKEMVTSSDPEELNRFLAQALEDARALVNHARTFLGGGSAAPVLRNMRTDRKTLGPCPACGGDVIQGSKAFGCSNWRNGCRFTLWPESLAGMGHGRLTEREISSLLRGRTKLKFKRKSGGFCLRPVELEAQEDGRWLARVDREAEIQPEELGDCPVEGCGGRVVESPKAFGCSRWRESCRFTVWKQALEKLGGAPIGRSQVRKLLAGPAWLKFKQKSGPVCERLCRLELRQERWSVQVDFQTPARPERIGSCPCCGSDVIERPKSFSCQATIAEAPGDSPASSCGFVIWKDSLTRRGGGELKKNQVRKLLAGEELILTLTREKGKVEAFVRLDAAGVLQVGRRETKAAESSPTAGN